MENLKPLDPGALYHHSDPSTLPFESTNDLIDLDDAIGQPRAVAAVRFGIGIDKDGYNIYAMGPAGVGKQALVQKYFELRAAREPVPDEWCYVHNFQDQSQPRAISLPAGKGMEFKQDMDRFVQELQTTLVAAFESDEYRARRQLIEQEVQEQEEKSLGGLQAKAGEQEFALIRTPSGLVFAPTRGGEVLSPEEYQNLPEEDRKRLDANLEGLQEELKKILQEVPKIQREIRERLKSLNQDVTNYAVGGMIDELQNKYREFPEVDAHLQSIQEDVVEHVEELLQPQEEAGERESGLMAALAHRASMDRFATLGRYRVNLLIDHSEQMGAPVIFDDNPTYQNLIGSVEHIAQMGALVTDFSLIRPGSLHKANGGYLILDVRKVLQQPFSWDALKRALQSKNLRIESVGQMLSLVSTVSLEPEPIPLDVKVALIGDRLLYYMLAQADPEFLDLFKVQADFEEQMDRNDGNQLLYARLIATMVHNEKLSPFDRDAVARVIEHSSRMVSDAEKLTTDIDSLKNLLLEASYWAGENGNGMVTAQDVQNAIDAQIYRADRLREMVHETILRGTFLIDTQGEKAGQVNGLSVIQMGGFAFGRPSRITATVRMGKGDVIDIEREVDLSGPIHSKGVLILSGFIGSRYAQERPLSLSASLVFEQSYSGVEGDSASSAELYALLSAIANVPIKQSFAVTGAINQLGQVQAIGGVNEKIEGFFDICKARGLTGDQGVLIPATNIKHLMLRGDVIAAVEAGQFAIYPVENVDQGIELLTGIPAGKPDAQGSYPSDSLNGLVMARLEEFAKKVEQLRAETQGRKEAE